MNEIFASDHLIEDFIKREFDGKGTAKFTFDDIVNVCKLDRNYVDIRNNRDIRFYSNLAVVSENGKHISLMYRKKVSPHWKKI